MGVVEVRTYVRKSEMPVWWTGPWKISEFCAADRHNTVRAARGRDGTGARIAKCICPRALVLGAEDIRRLRLVEGRRKARESVKERGLPRLPDVRAAVYLKKMPDLSAGACRRHPEVMDQGANRFDSVQGARLRAEAREVCESCPLKTRQDCLTYVQENESPAGSWVGIWGGLDPWQRMEAAR
jgi:hypothetical protein